MGFLFSLRLLAVITFVSGIFLAIKGYDGKYGIEYTTSGAMIWCLIGACMLVYSLLPSVRKKSNRQNEYYKTSEMICKKCGSTFKEKYVQVKICPKCNGELININENPER